VEGVLVEKFLELWVNRAPEATSGSQTLPFQCGRFTLLWRKELLLGPLPFPSQRKIRIQPSLDYLSADSV